MFLVAGSEAGNPRSAHEEVDWSGGAHDPVGVNNPRQRSGRASQRITALGEMTGGIAHDFRNILAVIASSLSLAERDPGDLEKLCFCLAAAQEGVGRGLKLTSRLLAFAKQQEREPSAENINNLLRTLETFLQYGAGPGIRIVLDLAPDLPKCRIDQSQFNAAVLNLLVNARDAMPAGGAVEISTRIITEEDSPGTAAAPGSFVRVRVGDQGQGMPPAVVDRIFDPYFTTKGETGTGLGLPQVYAFMKQIGGRVSVASEVGIGSTFDLLFPVFTDHLPAGRLFAQIDRRVNEGGAGSERLPAKPGESQRQATEKLR